MKAKSSFAAIANLVKDHSNVIEIGNTDPSLLVFLEKNKQAKVTALITDSGLDLTKFKNIDFKLINLEEDFSTYHRNFDYVILDKKIHQLKNPEEILQESLKIGKFVIVSLDNFAFFKNRFHLLLTGNITKENQGLKHHFSINDFRKLCQKLDFSIKKQLFLTGVKVFSNKMLANFFAKEAFFLIEKNEISPTIQESFILSKKLNPEIKISYCPSSLVCK